MKRLLFIALLFFAPLALAGDLPDILKDKFPIMQGTCRLDKNGLMVPKDKKGAVKEAGCVALVKQGDEKEMWFVILDDKDEPSYIIHHVYKTKKQRIVWRAGIGT